MSDAPLQPDERIPDAPVGESAMGRLLDRPLPEADLREQTARVQRAVAASGGAVRSLMLMRLGAECLALPAADVVRVRPELPVHRIPHRSSNVIRGLCNVDGELVLTAALDQLLQTGPAGAEPTPEARDARRTVVIASEGGRWAFVVDAVEGVEQVGDAALRPLPVTVERALVHYARSIVTLADGQATLLDAQRIASGLETMLA